MKFIKKHIRLFTGLLGVFVAIALLFSIGYGIADEYRSDLDSRLHTESSKPIGEVGDATFLSDYSKVDDFVDAMKGIGERIEEEGVVLLKNDGALPIDTSAGKVGITLFGVHSYNLRYGGSVNAAVNKTQCVDLTSALKSNGFSINNTMATYYNANRAKTNGDASGEYGGATVNELSLDGYSGGFDGYTGAAIIVLGRDSGESLDYYPGAAGLADSSDFSQSKTGNIFSLSNEERALLTYVEGQGFSKIIVLLNTTSTMEVQELEDDSKIDAVMWIGNPGPYGTTGIAKVLNGTVSPSGHMADTYAVNTAAAPSAQNYGVYTYSNSTELSNLSTNNSWYIAELEGIYTGYKYYETRYYDSIASSGSNASGKTSDGRDVAYSTYASWDYDQEVTYPFGYGLSYTTFSEEITSAEVNLDGTTTVSVKVTNTGNVAAKHSVQLYVSLPWEEGQVEKSAIQLVGYAKTGDAEESENGYDYSKAVMLGAGESETVTITVPNTYFASYDESYSHDGVTGAFVLDEGDYYFTTGNGAHEAVQNVLRAQGKLTDETVSVGTCGEDGAYAATDGAGANVIKITLGEGIAITESEAGSTIENQLQSADLNSYGMNVTYLSRADWTGTFPATMASFAATQTMIDNGLKNDIYDSTAANADPGSIPDHTFGTSGESGTSIVTLVDEPFNSDKFEDVISSIPLDTMVAQITKGFQKIPSISEIGMPDVYANGTTNGQYVNLGAYSSMYDSTGNTNFDCRVFPLETVVASTFSHRIAEIEGQTIGNQSLWTGMLWWYGVGSNLHRSPYNARNMDYYSEDSILSGTMGMDVCVATAPYGLITGVKHFAFNTMESHRTGVSTYFNEQSARENELRSFELEIKSGAVDGIMAAYNRLGPTLSAANNDFITGLLRTEWGYDGIVITDLVQDSQGAAYVLPTAILAGGSDLIMSSSSSLWNDFNSSFVQSDKYLTDCVYNSWHHLLYSIANSSVLNTVTENTVIVRAYPWWEVTIITGIVVTWVLVAACVALAAVGTAGTLIKKKEVN